MKKKVLGTLSGLVVILLAMGIFASCTGGEQPEGDTTAVKTVSGNASSDGQAKPDNPSGSTVNSTESKPENESHELPTSGTTNNDEGWSKYY